MEKTEYKYKAQVYNVVDGDTYDVIIDLGFDISVKHRIRLFGVDAYESSLRGNTTPEEKIKGLKAKDFCEETFKKAHANKASVIVETIQDKKGKFGRYLAKVYIDGVSIADMLEEKGFLKNA
jgi:micrococcal nuclease